MAGVCYRLALSLALAATAPPPAATRIAAQRDAWRPPTAAARHAAAAALPPGWPVLRGPVRHGTVGQIISLGGASSHGVASSGTVKNTAAAFALEDSAVVSDQESKFRPVDDRRRQPKLPVVTPIDSHESYLLTFFPGIPITAGDTPPMSTPCDHAVSRAGNVNTHTHRGEWHT
eukprot:COSAG01_NODE_4423_length_5036_cov_22.765445_7_plen_174_part_00